MDELAKGTWLINSIKHMVGIRTNTPELAYFEATEVAGKAGTLLARLVADEQEVVSASKVKVFARESGITRGEMTNCLTILKKLGKVDFIADAAGNPKEVEVYCFSARDALETTSSAYDFIGPSEHEDASLISLDYTFHVPSYKEEIIEKLTASGVSEEVATTTIDMQEALELIKTSEEFEEKVYFNEYAFAGDPAKIARALRSIPERERQIVQDVQKLVEENPGYSLERLARRVPSQLLKMMEGVGLLDGLTVHSDIGDATFLTVPQLKGISIESSILSTDVFHKAKVLLSCLRFGEVKSQSWRGKIDTQQKMMNIINKLLRGEPVGPCTAIGQDYQLLEKDGVIVTNPARAGMYFMLLRQREVGILVKQMLELNRVFPEADTELQRLLEKQPTAYTTPEARRPGILASQTKSVKKIREQLLQSLRTGMR